MLAIHGRMPIVSRIFVSARLSPQSLKDGVAGCDNNHKPVVLDVSPVFFLEVPLDPSSSMAYNPCPHDRTRAIKSRPKNPCGDPAAHADNASPSHAARISYISTR